MTNVALSTIELCAGVGMLGEGVSAGFEYLGVDSRTVCYVEREAPAAAQLVALMEAGALAPAPIWSDMLTFDAAAWRDAVDCIVAGFPCQDLSIAGRRAGLNGKRSGLFFTVLDIADACGAWFLVLENVSGIASATASVVDEAEGELEERAAARVLGELADRGWHAEWITLPASDVGANHERNRWFCIAWRMAHTGLQHQHLQQRAHGAEHSGSGQPMAHAERAERRPERIGGLGSIQGHDAGGREEDGGPGIADQALGDAHGQREQQPWQQDGTEPRERPRACSGGSGGSGGSVGTCGSGEFRGVGLANPTGDGRDEGRTESGGEQRRLDATQCGGSVPAGVGQADTGIQGLSQPEQPVVPGAGRGIEGGAAEQLRGAPLFAPGPSDPIWQGLLNAGRLGAWSRAVADDEAGACPWAPATKPGVRMLADGVALLVDESRNHQLRQVGNGVVPLQAAYATVVLARRAGILMAAPPTGQSQGGGK